LQTKNKTKKIKTTPPCLDKAYYPKKKKEKPGNEEQKGTNSPA